MTAVPSATLVEQALSGDSPTLPSWAEEPVRLIGNIVAGALAFLTAVSAALLFATDLAPESMRDELGVVVSGIGVAVVAVTKAQAWLTRQKVWSPSSAARATKQALYQLPPAEPGLLPHVAQASGAVVHGSRHVSLGVAKGGLDSDTWDELTDDEWQEPAPPEGVSQEDDPPDEPRA